ncbi:MAG: DNA cytosine methyltransferase [Cellulosilyticum sp.]|nr:DNA cytosine methyltransferase [Cellulosilyticum sp.]
MVVLSLFDGISCGRLALQRAGIEVDKYFASEIDKDAIKVTMNNFPDTIQIGDVYNVHYKDGKLITDNGTFEVNIDLLIGGSSCQSLSTGNPNATGLAEGGKSHIFFEFLRLRDEIKPKYWLLENVKCANKYRDAISQYLGVHPVLIDSALVSYQHRPRYYWSNMKFGQPKDKHINFQDYKEEEVSPDDITMFSKSPCNVKAYNLTVRDEKAKYRYRDVTNSDKVYTLMCKKDRPSQSVIMCNGFMRSLTRKELELAQTLPLGYTDGLTYHQAHKVIGNGWTVDVIAHILKEGITNG